MNNLLDEKFRQQKGNKMRETMNEVKYTSYWENKKKVKLAED